MNNKFVNLPIKYKNLIKEIENILDNNLIKKISNSSISFEEVSNLHKNINLISNKNECNSFDINRMIHGYKKKNSVIEILKKIASIRNKHLVTEAYKLPLWNSNIKNLNERSKIALNLKDINLNSTEKGFLNLLKKYKYDWDGMWSIIETSKNGKVKNISVFDIDDFEFILNNSKF